MNRLFDVKIEADDKYSKKILIPQYTPDRRKPNIEECFGLDKYNELVRNINNSNLLEEEKRFLRFAATRHIVFRYDKIADYYANVDAEMQKLMEQSALVIIDVDDAIANGYIKLSKDIRSILEASGEMPNEK